MYCCKLFQAEFVKLYLDLDLRSKLEIMLYGNIIRDSLSFIDERPLLGGLAFGISIL